MSSSHWCRFTQEGREARAAGRLLSDNPHEVGSLAQVRWRIGWHQGVYEAPTIGPMDDDDAKGLLERLSCRNLRTLEHDRGVAWSLELLLDGRHVLTVNNDGNGGCCRVNPPPRTPLEGHRAAQVLAGRIEVAAKRWIGHEFENLDALCAAMEPGMNGLQAAVSARALFERYQRRCQLELA